MNKSDHFAFISEHGEFEMKTSLAIFSKEEITLIKKYGHWFAALVSGDLDPISERQKNFIEVFRSQKPPKTFEEKAWFKYTGRLKLELENPEIFQSNYTLNTNEFFSREDYYKLHPSRRNRR